MPVTWWSPTLAFLRRRSIRWRFGCTRTRRRSGGLCCPARAPADHKYSRGHALVVGGDGAHSGAARLAARAALRVGAGLVTVHAPEDALPVYASQLTAVMIASMADLDAALADERRNALLIGPGSGVSPTTRVRALQALRAGKRCVLDADALTAFRNDPRTLFDALTPESVLTPHEGE